MAYDYNDFKLVTKLNEPAKLFLWDFDQAAIVIITFSVGVMASMMVFFCAVGFILSHYWKRFKGGKNPWFLIHGAYWFLPLSSKSIRTGSSASREFMK